MRPSSRLAGALVALGLTFAPTLRAQSVPAAPDSIDQFLAAKMRQQRIPGLQLAIVRHGQLVKLAQYGLANVQDRKSVV